MSNRTFKLLGLCAAIVGVALAMWLWRGGGAREHAATDVAGPESARITRVQGDTPEPGPATTSIAGAVLARDALGRAIAGARVCAWQLDAEQERTREHAAARCVTTGPDGRYALRELEPGRHRVIASAPGKLPGLWRDADHDDRPYLLLGRGEAKTGIDLALADGGVELRGAVVDVSGGPVEGALVIAMGPGFEREPVATGISDADGGFAIAVRDGEYSLRGEAPGYAPGSAVAIPQVPVELRLTPESALIGRVVDASGQGVAGVRVTAEPQRPQPAAISDAQGEFRLAGLPPGVYQPEAIGETVYGQAAIPVHIGLGQTSAPIELRVYPAVRVRGQIVAHDLRRGEDRGCAGGHVYLHGGGFTRHVYADDDGWVVVDGVPPGRHRLAVHCPGEHESIATALDVVAGLAEQRWLLDVGGWTIAGEVVDASGRGLEGVFVDARGPGGASMNKTTSDGEFDLAVREPGAYRLSASFRGPAEAVVELTVEVVDDVDGVELRVGEVASLRGRVEDPQGQPAAGVAVAVCDARGRPRHYGRSDVDGVFVFDNLPVGPVRVALQSEVAIDEREPGQPVELVAGQLAEVTLVREAKTGSIRGTVTAEGGPAADAWIVAGRGTVDELAADWEIGPVLADLDGSFTLDGLGEGGWAVRAFRSDGAEASVAGVALDSTIALALQANASVAGRVHLPDQTAPEHFEISARSGERRRVARFYRSDGAFELAALAAGTWTLEVHAESGSATVEVELTAGQELRELDVELEPRVTITGRAVDSRTRAPVTVVEIGLQQGGYGLRVRPDADGRFELPGVPPGRIQLMVTPRDWRGGAYRWQFPVVDVQPEPLAQDIGELELAGGELEPGEQPGELGFEVQVVGVQDIEGADARHVKVSKVAPGGPAASAGLREGDVISSVDGFSVEGRRAGHVHAYLKVAAGAVVVLDRREGGELSVTAVARAPSRP